MKETVNKIKSYMQWFMAASENIRIYLITGTVLGIIKVIFGLLFVMQSKHIIDIATGTYDGSLWRETYVLIGILLVELLLSILNTYFYTVAENRMKNNLRYRLFGILMVAPLFRRGSYHSGDLTARLEEDVRVVTSNIATAIPTVIITGTQFLGAFWLLMKFDSRLTWIIVCILPVFMVTGKILGSRLREMTKDIRNYESKIQAYIQEGLQHSTTLRSLEAETYVKKNLDSLQNTVYGKIMKRTRFTLTSRSMLSVGFTTGYIVAFVWGCFSIHSGAISFGVMTAFLQLVAKVQGPTANLAQLLPGIIHASASVDRLMEIESIETEKSSCKVRLKGMVGIRLEDVSYTYPDERNAVYKNFSYDFYPGSRTAVIGHTGTGKTTLFRMILSLIRPEKGRILIYDNNQTHNVSPDTRCNISYVPQGNTLLSGTVMDNLLMANPYATQQEIEQAIHTAVADFVYELPQGLNTMCGEQGMGLSEGQAQRIAIARGLLKPAPILLLDEISASLDKETEAKLFKRLMDSSHDKTIIFITHRTSVSEYCNQVLQL